MIDGPMDPRTTNALASDLGLRKPKGLQWWNLHALIDAAVVRYWEKVADDPTRRRPRVEDAA